MNEKVREEIFDSTEHVFIECPTLERLAILQSQQNQRSKIKGIIKNEYSHKIMFIESEYRQSQFTIILTCNCISFKFAANAK